MSNYNGLASLMGEHQELAIFRKFQTLNAKNLLYMQAEILHLEHELHIIEFEDQTSSDKSRAPLHTSLFNLKDSSGTQWNKVLELRGRLQSYNKALVAFSHVQALPRPCTRDISTLQDWLDRPEGGDFFLEGREADTWGSRDDVLTLSMCQIERDVFSGFMNDCVAPWYHAFCNRWHKKDSRRENPLGVWHYRYDSMRVAVNAISTLLSSLLPSASIFLLYFVENPVARLAAIMVFTTVFSTVLSTFTKARRIDVFAATTAFAAVQAVFVGGSGLCLTPQQ
ncbi:MAG: hypothetical protein Q9210_006633 [Variospora velana]